ncbi:hypothetical protein Taro_010803 [Colocasia esculenta]|uniref:Uncharacterized protein n=1 Tax=Colocasia esculenta TaxID=4460 RepID=A0A843UAP0_COLES|nr:hypothetical protein [Colocasia esculenta]
MIVELREGYGCGGRQPQGGGSVQTVGEEAAPDGRPLTAVAVEVPLRVAELLIQVAQGAPPPHPPHLLSAPEASTPQLRIRAVRKATDRILANAAKGCTRWSRAMLSKCQALKFRRKRRVVPPGCSCQRKLELTTLPVGKVSELDRKVRTLGRLVPDCRNSIVATNGLRDVHLWML